MSHVIKVIKPSRVTIGETRYDNALLLIRPEWDANGRITDLCYNVAETVDEENPHVEDEYVIIAHRSLITPVPVEVSPWRLTYEFYGRRYTVTPMFTAIAENGKWYAEYARKQGVGTEWSWFQVRGYCKEIVYTDLKFSGDEQYPLSIQFAHAVEKITAQVHAAFKDRVNQVDLGTSCGEIGFLPSLSFGAMFKGSASSLGANHHLYSGNTSAIYGRVMQAFKEVATAAPPLIEIIRAEIREIRGAESSISKTAEYDTYKRAVSNFLIATAGPDKNIIGRIPAHLGISQQLIMHNMFIPHECVGNATMLTHWLYGTPFSDKYTADTLSLLSRSRAATLDDCSAHRQQR